MIIQDMEDLKCIGKNSIINKDFVVKAKEDLITKYDADRAYTNYLIKTLRKAEGNILYKIDINESRIIKVACEELLRDLKSDWSPM